MTRRASCDCDRLGRSRDDECVHADPCPADPLITEAPEEPMNEYDIQLVREELQRNQENAMAKGKRKDHPLVLIANRAAELFEEIVDAGVLWKMVVDGQKADIIDARTTVPDPWPVIDWISENYPQALQRCPYKARRFGDKPGMWEP